MISGDINSKLQPPLPSNKRTYLSQNLNFNQLKPCRYLKLKTLSLNITTCNMSPFVRDSRLWKYEIIDFHKFFQLYPPPPPLKFDSSPPEKVATKPNFRKASQLPTSPLKMGAFLALKLRPNHTWPQRPSGHDVAMSLLDSRVWSPGWVEDWGLRLKVIHADAGNCRPFWKADYMTFISPEWKSGFTIYTSMPHIYMYIYICISYTYCCTLRYWGNHHQDGDFFFFGRVVQPVDSSVYADSIFLDKEGVRNYLVMYCTSDQFWQARKLGSRHRNVTRLLNTSDLV